MNILYYGGQKSGKSLLAEQKALQLSTSDKPYYIATYNNSYDDPEMQERIDRHQAQRQASFVTIEEPFDLCRVIHPDQIYLVDCLSMWILNTLEEQEEGLLAQLKSITQCEATIVFVLNEVTAGVIPMDKESRKFVDRSGVFGQEMAKICDEVYEVKLGMARRLK